MKARIADRPKPAAVGRSVSNTAELLRDHPHAVKEPSRPKKSSTLIVEAPDQDIRENEMTILGEMTVEHAAREAAGNWRRFECFAWDRERNLDDPDDWAIVYTHNRDSGLLDLSNADATAKVLEPYTEGDDPDVVFESHSHWAVGHVEGFSIRVYRDGEITEAFETYHGLAERMDGYPILDEEDYGRREYEATLENIDEAAWRLMGRYELPEGWEGDVFSWLLEHRQGVVENRDDRGGYPEEADLRVAFEALGYGRAA